MELFSELVVIHECILYAFLLQKVGFQVGRIDSLCCPLPLITAFLFLFDQLICGLHVNITLTEVKLQCATEDFKKQWL